VDARFGAVFTTSNNPTIDALRFSGVGAGTINVSGNMIIGSILVSPEVGANDVTISGNNELRMPRNGDLVIWQNNTRAI